MEQLRNCYNEGAHHVPIRRAVLIQHAVARAAFAALKGRDAVRENVLMSACL